MTIRDWAYAKMLEPELQAKTLEVVKAQLALRNEYDSEEGHLDAIRKSVVSLLEAYGCSQVNVIFTRDELDGLQMGVEACPPPSDLFRLGILNDGWVD